MVANRMSFDRPPVAARLLNDWVIQMGNLRYLAEPRVERSARQIRSELAKLRQRQLSLLAANAQPERNPDLDPVLELLRLFRANYDLQVREFEVDERTEVMEVSVLAHAREILSDVGELADLLVWFGAKSHIQADIGGHSASFRG